MKSQRGYFMRSNQPQVFFFEITNTGEYVFLTKTSDAFLTENIKMEVKKDVYKIFFNYFETFK